MAVVVSPWPAIYAANHISESHGSGFWDFDYPSSLYYDEDDDYDDNDYPYLGVIIFVIIMVLISALLFKAIA